MVELRLIDKSELKCAYKLHRQGFMPTFFKYFDRINPIFTSFNKFKRYYAAPDLHMFWIMLDGSIVGEIWIKAKCEAAMLARIFVLKEFQNRGIAQQAIMLAEGLFPATKWWRLDTIKQEKNNCHLYEKMGYTPCGVERRINRRMTIMNYEKRSN